MAVVVARSVWSPFMSIDLFTLIIYVDRCIKARVYAEWWCRDYVGSESASDAVILPLCRKMSEPGNDQQAAADSYQIFR
jgi:hypothetical protein